MEKSDGFQWNFIKQERTRILPLRWFANLCEKFAAYSLGLAMCHDDHGDNGLVFKYHATMAKLFYKPYFWWGTIYKLDSKLIDKARKGNIDNS